ncbi:hypothetical protein Lsai_3243 [Legionella sainthelensi]|uniref:Uncharacterized protein n=1 Tax=Legionella sainthelensi TaxID=28087 RepID=A0A0W0YBZ9_9GAMM|nr:hypothetical protein [Legionella sainthelensi]AUH73107.1 hypothetical protein CAB17_14400 [Legionella sainthelensi]KTD54421.1 hypothetical protein Lsai_3243 [Legionella sainthelensi]VEH33221.1 Uncharacterised protein [Legionella sainthelensi]
MKREHIIESLVNQFAENIKNLSDETLQDVESGKLVISLTPAVGKEAGGKGPIAKEPALAAAKGIAEPRRAASPAIAERVKTLR